MEKPIPSISIVIPLYNKELYIERTLNSVLSQTYSNFECIIVDSSDDCSSDIVARYSDPRIRHIISKPRTSHSHARNLGINIAKSVLIAFLDADDEWTPDHLHAIIALHQHFPDGGIYTTPYIKILPNGLEKTMIFADLPPPPWQGYISRYFLTCSKGDVPVHSSSCAIQKRIIENIGGFDENLSEVGEDQHLWARIALRYPVVFTWEGPAIYHTEASGRICNEPRKTLKTDPLNEYLQDIIDQDKITSDLKSDIKVYISRRNKMIFTSSLLNDRVGCDEKDSNKKPLNPFFRLFFALGLKKISSRVIISVYNSGIHNFFIRIWCYLHGWHVPVIE